MRLEWSDSGGHAEVTQLWEAPLKAGLKNALLQTGRWEPAWSTSSHRNFRKGGYLDEPGEWRALHYPPGKRLRTADNFVMFHPEFA